MKYHTGYDAKGCLSTVKRPKSGKPEWRASEKNVGLGGGRERREIACTSSFVPTNRVLSIRFNEEKADGGGGVWVGGGGGGVNTGIRCCLWLCWGKARHRRGGWFRPVTSGEPAFQRDKGCFLLGMRNCEKGDDAFPDYPFL